MSDASPDGIEFSQFTADIPMILQSTWLIDDSAWQEQIVDMLAGPFNQYDACVNGLCVNTLTTEQVLDVFTDTPLSVEHNVWGSNW